MHEAAGLISIEGSLGQTTQEERVIPRYEALTTAPIASPKSLKKKKSKKQHSMSKIKTES